MREIGNEHSEFQAPQVYPDSREIFASLGGSESETELAAARARKREARLPLGMTKERYIPFSRVRDRSGIFFP